MKKLILFLFTFLLSQGDVFAADCNLSFNSPNISVTWNENFSYQTISFNVFKTGEDPCYAYFGFSKGLSNSYDRAAFSGQESLRYQLYKDLNQTIILREALDTPDINDLLSVYFESSGAQTKEVIFIFKIPNEFMITPFYKKKGVYTDSLILNLYSNNFTIPIQSNPLNITVNIPPIIDVGLTSSGGSILEYSEYTLNLGDLSQNQSKTLDLYVKSNAGYRVYFSSQNGGKLSHSLLQNQEYSLPYSFLIDGINCFLTTIPQNCLTLNLNTTPTGNKHSLNISTTAVTNLLSGSYGDIIFITTETIE